MFIFNKKKKLCDAIDVWWWEGFHLLIVYMQSDIVEVQMNQNKTINSQVHSGNINSDDVEQ